MIGKKAAVGNGTAKISINVICSSPRFVCLTFLLSGAYTEQQETAPSVHQLFGVVFLLVVS